MADVQQEKPAVDVDAETQRIGRQVWNQMERRTPSIFDRRWWDDRILSWAMSDESVKVQMFRFVDVLPMLKTHQQISEHLQDYFEDVRRFLPWAARIGLDISRPNTVMGRIVAVNARSNARNMAQRFIAGSNVDEVLQSVSKLRKQGFAFTLDLLGEAVISEPEAEAYQEQYLDLINGLGPHVNAWAENMQIDTDQYGPIPRMQFSVKLSSLYSQFKVVDPQGTSEGVKERLRPILRAAREHDAYIHVDMESYNTKDLTLEIFKDVFMEDEFRDFPHVGIVIQAYLPEAEQDLKGLLEWVRKRGTPIWVRLVKGAYWDYETVHAKAAGWPVPVYRQKWQSDENFERQTKFLFEHYEELRPQIASHNLRSLAHAIAYAKQLNIPPSAWEIQMLYGMGNEMAQIFEEMGHRVRVYTPFGELIPGMAYLVRRLLENTSNDSFLRQSFREHVSIEDLLMSPTEVGQKTPPPAEEPVPAFVNEPHSDFSDKTIRAAMQEALEDVKAQLGREYSLVINGRAVDSNKTITSRNPSKKSQIVGRVASASPDHVTEAISAARRAFKSWSRTDPEHRAEYLELVAREMRERKYELAAWEVYECGKPWAEADADVAEAIDFCMYYALQMRELAKPRSVDVPGEENEYFYRPRGVAVVIAPWNFPLAILTGMTAAALVTGNTVVMKPAEQSPIIASKLMQIFQDIGLPDGVVHYLPGIGEEVGPELVGSPDVDLIAFTGSRSVGLGIYEQAAQTDPRQENIKHVIAELGGKNAIIIDSDADLDEAVTGVIQSAFGYSGQKCSACSRAIVLADVYDAFLDRLVAATESLNVGPAEEPGTAVGPVIDEEAYVRIKEVIGAESESDSEEQELALAGDDGPGGKEGYYIGPHIFAGVDPNSSLAQEEIFGPVLAVIKADDMDEAFEIANGTDFALTGGMFSRSPKNLRRARQEFQVGNLYLNRNCTGALVERQPFGGYKMSGLGSKAGGPDYLLQFLIPVNITENTLRRGFAPPSDDDNSTPTPGKKSAK